MDRFQNRYRIASARADWWHYGWAGAYFITICTRDRVPCFGNIRDGRMHLSHIGIVADICWYEIRNHAREVDSGAFVVMPNHIHGILILKSDNEQVIVENDGNGNVETRHALSLPRSDPRSLTPGQQRFQNPGKNTVSSIIGSYKSAVTKHVRRLGFEFGWQTRFHDHIIRNDREYQHINDYIETNPQQWDADRFYCG